MVSVPGRVWTVEKHSGLADLHLIYTLLRSRVRLEEIESNLGLKFHAQLDRQKTADLCEVQVSISPTFYVQL